MQKLFTLIMLSSILLHAENIDDAYIAEQQMMEAEMSDQNSTEQEDVSVLSTLVEIAKDSKELSKFSNDMKIDSTLDENSKYRPDLYIPWMWNDSIESAIEYRIVDTLEEDVTSTSGVTTTLAHTVVKLHALKYRVNNWQVGAGLGSDAYSKLH